MSKYPFQPANALLLVADCPDQLRACDVQRLADDCGQNWPAMREWLRESYAIMSPRVKGAIDAAEPDEGGDV